MGADAELIRAALRDHLADRLLPRSIRARRLQAGLTVLELARLARVGNATITALEHGQRVGEGSRARVEEALREIEAGDGNPSRASG